MSVKQPAPSPVLPPYLLIRSDRKTVAIQVERDGRVVVRAPKGCTRAEAEDHLRQHLQWVEHHRLRQQAYAAAHPDPTETELVRLTDRARQVLPPLIAHHAKRMGVTPAGFSVTRARTRLGSCSFLNRLNFSCLLMQYPHAAVEYVVVHELAHIRHKNHSPAFWQEVEHYLPDWRQRKALLDPQLPADGLPNADERE